jgi:DNA-binding response OmpR family regulator
VSEILLCTQNPILIKGIYGILRDEGYGVEIADYPAHAVQKILHGEYRAVIIDTHAFGLPAEDAVRIIRVVSPEIVIILVGCREYEADALSVRMPVDLGELKRLVHGIHEAGTISHT